MLSTIIQERYGIKIYCYIKKLLIITLVTCLPLLLTTCTEKSNDVMDSSKPYPQVQITGSEVREIQSSITGDTYSIYVSVPRGYEDTSKTYPTLYIMDADGAFGTYTEISRLLALNNEIPEMIIVGIAYDVSFTEYLYNRQRDYTPTAVDDFPGSGGGMKFLDFIQNELIPLIDKAYRVNKSERAISGFSYGGLFVLYTLFHKPELFNRYHAGSVSFWWDNYVIFEFEQKYFEKSKNLPVRLFLTAGSLEDQDGFVKPLEKFTKIINTRKYSGLEFEHIILDEETHFSNFGSSLTKGLKWLFKNY